MSIVPPPPRGLGKQALRTAEVEVSILFRISRHDSGEPYFGKSAANRFDDPTRKRSERFGTCYLGSNLEVAIAETILHDEMPVRGAFSIAASEIEDRQVVRFVGSKLVLADLTGVALKTLMGSGAISTVMPYDIAQRWARALHNHPAKVDGLLYMSRHVNDRKAVVVFDRAKAKLGTASYSQLMEADGALQALHRLRVSVKYV